MFPNRLRTPDAAPAALPGAATAADLPAGLPEPVAALARAAEVTDAELVRRALSGQHDPFAALVARYQKRAWWIAYHVVGCAEEARDVAQESFVRLYRSLGKYDFARSFYTWFYRIVMNLAIDALRKRKSARATSLDDVAFAVADATPGGTAPLERQETDAQVWAVLDQLDARFRAVLVLRDLHGMSCREIAPILRITHATARWRLHRGRQAFRDHWERLQGGAR